MAQVKENRMSSEGVMVMDNNKGREKVGEGEVVLTMSSVIQPMMKLQGICQELHFTTVQLLDHRQKNPDGITQLRRLYACLLQLVNEHQLLKAMTLRMDQASPPTVLALPKQQNSSNNNSPQTTPPEEGLHPHPYVGKGIKLEEEEDKKPVRNKNLKFHLTTDLTQRTRDKNKRKRNRCEGMECQHCGAKESAEWRRGPLGKNTLCNACGLKYSRLTQNRREAGESVKSVNYILNNNNEEQHDDVNNTQVSKKLKTYHAS